MPQKTSRKWKTSKHWQLQEAKAKFSEVFEKALMEGPQYVTRRNKDAVVIIPSSEYAALKGGKDQPSIVDTFLEMPKVAGFRIPPRNKNDVVPTKPIFEE